MGVKKIIVITMPEYSSVEEASHIRGYLIKKLGDEYVVLIIQGIEGQPVSFQMFTDEKIEPIELDELKAHLKRIP